MACTNSSAHRFLLPSVVPKVTTVANTPMVDNSWVLDMSDTSSSPMRGAVCILGKIYRLPEDEEAIEKDVYSKLWFTYRKNFRQIGGTNIRTDFGWGCTLRCGQMMLAYSLMLRHLDREWRYDPNNLDEDYNRILKMFHDTRDSEYSIQLIALQGADLGRSVGQWFGPNNVAHSIKRLCKYDHWSKLAVYVALDMLVIIEDMKMLCRQPHGIDDTVSVEVTKENGETVPLASKPVSKSDTSLNDTRKHTTAASNNTTPSRPSSKMTIPKIAPSRTKQAPKISLSFSPTSIPNSLSRSYDPNCDSAVLDLNMEDFHKQFSGEPNLTPSHVASQDEDIDSRISSPDELFRPLLLFIPLRLGQEKFNMEYAEALKACFTLPQSVGVIGGKPRHALWFIGTHDNDILFLDPHTCQPFVPLTDEGLVPDETYHVKHPEKININDLDPSLALGFYCKDENDIDDLCRRLKSDVLSKMSYMFELTRHRPSYWGPPDSAKRKETSKEPFLLLEPESIEIEEGFELVEWPYPAELDKGSWPHTSK